MDNLLTLYPYASPPYSSLLNYDCFMMSASSPPPFSPPNHRLFTPPTAPIYSFDWSPHSAHFCSLAVGSFVTQTPFGVDSHRNQVQMATLTDPQVSEFSAPSSTSSISVDYPITKVQFSPHRHGDSHEFLGVSGDGLRIYRNHLGGGTELVAKLVPAQISTSPTVSATASRRPSDANIITTNSNSSGISGFSGTPRNSPAPITSFDWNRVDPNLLVTSSYDTTCAVWNLDTASVKTQLIAHDKEVFDVAFNPKSSDIFASVGAEGSIRLFDTRSLDHSTILYETGDAQPLLRLAWNPLDNNYVACFGVDSKQVVIVDVRSAAVPVAILSDPTGGGAVSSMRWAPHNSGWLAVSDAAGLKLWDVSQNVVQPAWTLPQEFDFNGTVQNLVWPANAPDWIAASTATNVHLIKL